MRTGFTIVELLVVITIIVVLLALLAPAMDQAVYQAELASCSAKLDAIATGVTTYAAENGRAYPYRPTLAEASSGRWFRPYELANQNGGDNRPHIRQALGGSLNKPLLDPLCGKIDLDHNYPPTDTMANYNLWFGMRYIASAGGGKGMIRMGDRLEWNDKSRGGDSMHGFSVLVSDIDAPYALAGSAYRVFTNHPAADDSLLFERFQSTRAVHAAQLTQVSQGLVSSWWFSKATEKRGPLDTNYAFADGSVERYNGVKWNDEDMARVPIQTGAQSHGTGNEAWFHLPRR